MPKTAAKPVIAVDIDDVLSATAEGFTDFSNKRWGTNLKPDDYTEHWAEMWKVDYEEERRRRDVLYAVNFIGEYRRFDEAEPVLKKLAQNYKLICLTSRGLPISKETVAWLDQHFGDIFSEVHFAGIWDDDTKHTLHKLNLTKAEKCKQLGVEYLIDDHPKHCLATAKLGIKSLLFGDYSWNREIKPTKNVIKVKNWPAVLEYFDAKS